MKILFIVPYTPNLIRVRAYQLLASLVQRQHQVTLATLWTTEEERADLLKLVQAGIRVVAHGAPVWRSLVNVVAALPTRTPLQAVYSWQPALAQSIHRLLQTEPFDVVHVEHLRGARYGLYVQSLQRTAKAPIPVVWDSVDCISHLFQQAAQASRSRKGRLLTQLDLKRTQRYEGRLVHQFDAVMVTSPTDQRALMALAQAAVASAASNPSQPAPMSSSSYAHLHVLPNGVDLAYFTPNDKGRAPATVVFSGKMSYHANVTGALHLVNDIMPQVWAQRADVKVCITGKDPAPAVQALATQHTATGYADRVQITGTVADLRPYLQQATVAAAPIPYGAGIQNKVLEAMACAAPVVASPQASSALQTQAGRDLLVADNAAGFAANLLQLLDQPAERSALGQAGRAYVEQFHSWDAVAAQLETIYATVIQKKRQAK